METLKKTARARQRRRKDSGAEARPPKTRARRELARGASESDLHALLAQRVRDARARRFMSRKALAEQSEISLAYLARVESGTGNISLGLLQRLSLALNLPIESFLAADEPANADFTMIVEFLRRQPPERLANIRKQLFDSRDAQRIALVGIRGVGKSTLGPLLAERLGIPFVELNREIEKEAKLDVSEIFSLYGQRGYRALERSCLERIVVEYPNVVLATGGGIVAEAATYELLLGSFFTVWLKAKPREMFERVLLQHDARIASAQLRFEAVDNIKRTLEARRHLYELAHAAYDTSGKLPGEIVSALAAALPAEQRPLLARDGANGEALLRARATHARASVSRSAEGSRT
jgi:XRE family transcriptional regulator, aerobic/anaerobic benzoate catabolism transcriptional regulator